jgi:bifunctional non-homologous end joining protein LigD
MKGRPALEGFVAKRLASRYLPGVRSRDRLKVKRPGWQDGRTWRK